MSVKNNCTFKKISSFPAPSSFPFPTSFPRRRESSEFQQSTTLDPHVREDDEDFAVSQR